MSFIQLIPGSLVQLITGIRSVFGGAQNKFTSQIRSYLIDGASVEHSEEGRLYIIPKSWDVTNALFYIEINISFKLSKARPIIPIVLGETAPSTDNVPETYEFHLSPGTMITGEQVLFFTFSSTDSFKRNIVKFYHFINQSYRPVNQIEELNKVYWEKLISARARLERESTRELDREAVEELWQRLRIYTYKNYEWIQQKTDRRINLDNIVRNVILDAITRVKQPFPKDLVIFLCHTIRSTVLRLVDAERDRGL
jgi:hypothetical protein